MTIDIQLAEHHASRHGFSEISGSERNRKLFNGPRLKSYLQSRNGMDLITKQLRDSTWRRHESHNKQLQHFMDRDRYQRNATWQAEYDRLASRPADPNLQPFVNTRIEQLKDLIVK